MAGKFIFNMQRTGTKAEKGEIENIMKGLKKNKPVKGLKDFELKQDEENNLFMVATGDAHFNREKILKKVRPIFEKVSVEVHPNNSEDGAGAGASGSSNSGDGAGASSSSNK